MKRIFMCLSITILSVMGVQAQDSNEIQARVELEKRLRAEMEMEKQEVIRKQTEYYYAEAAKRMQARKKEVLEDREARRAKLMHRPKGMAPLSIN